MFDDELQRDEHKRLSEEIEILLRPFVGIVSGYGVSLGYLGSIVGLLIVEPFV